MQEVIYEEYNDSFFKLNYVNKPNEISKETKKAIKQEIEYSIFLRKYKINKILKEIETLLKVNNNILDIVYLLEIYIEEINKETIYSNDFIFRIIYMYIFNSSDDYF